ncbi:MAG: carbohydrate kinase [Anaerolineales bacterium]|nr:carbohydrate kinase [Anaerolineales bacterium]
MDLDVLAIGETLVDFISEHETAHLRDAQVFHKFLGGSPANIAVNVAKLKGKSAILSKVGIGAFGQFLKSELGKHGVNTNYLVMDHRVHTSFIFIARSTGTPDFEPSRNGDFQLEPKDINPAAIARSRIIHSSAFALSKEPCRSAIKEAFRLAREQGKIISLDPNYSPVIWPDQTQARLVLEEMLGFATYTKPSLDDAHRIFGPGYKPEEYIQEFHRMGPPVVIFTMGREGTLISTGEGISHVPARKVQVVDVTGAGDSFWAGFLIALLDGNPIEKCVYFAREIAEIKLSSIGPLPDFIDRKSIYDRIEDKDAHCIFKPTR